MLICLLRKVKFICLVEERQFFSEVGACHGLLVRGHGWYKYCYYCHDPVVMLDIIVTWVTWVDKTWYNDTMLILTPMILIRVNSSDWCWYWTLTLSQLIVQLCSLIHNEGLKCFSSWSQPAQEDSRVFIQTTQMWCQIYWK